MHYTAAQMDGGMTGSITVQKLGWLARSRNQAEKPSKWFIRSAGVLLLVTGIAKIISVFGHDAVLRKPDPILGIHFDHLLLTVGLIELAIAVVCLTSANQHLALALVAALSINFLGYRAGMWLIHWNGYCPCLGTLTDAIHLSPRQAARLTGAAFIYLITGSFYFLGRSWWDLKNAERLQINTR
jgi:hypothetical protein